MKFKNIFLGLGLSLLMNTTFAQGGLQGIVVERYYQTNAEDGTNASTNSAINALATGTVVYRVYVDMAAGYKFSQLYGSSTHDFKLNTTTNFYNDPNYGTTTNPASISLTNAKKNTALIDSWFTAGGVCAGKSGVLKTEDTDGSIGNTQLVLDNNPGSCYGSPINGTNAQDGLVTSSSLTAVIPNILGITSTQLNLLDQGTGNSFLTNNGSIAALGGITGTTASNMVLVGQFTTNGVLSFELNVQIIAANGTAENWVARNRTGNEYTSPSLIFSSLPVAGTVSAAASTVCSGASSLLTLAGSDGTIQWQRSTTSATTGFSDIASANATTFNASNLTASAWYRAKVSKSSCAEVFTSAVLVTVNNPSAPSTTAQTFCSGTNPTVANLTATGNGIQWYSASTGGTALLSGSALSSGNYFASQTVSGCEGTNRTLTAITVNTTPSAPTATAQDFCAASLPTVANLGATGTAVQWFSASTGGTALSSTTALATGNYFASQTVTGCESATRTSVAVTLSTPIAGTVTASATSICINTSSLLTLAGSDGTIQWQISTTSASSGFTDISLANGTTYNAANLTVSTWYRAKVSKSTCSDVFTTAVKVTVTNVPSVGGTLSSDVTICRSSGTTLTLAGSSGTIVWQYSSNWTATTPTWSTVSGQTTTSLATGALTASRAYRVKLTSGSCISYSNQVIVNVSATSAVASITGAGTFCAGSNVNLTIASATGTVQWQESPTSTGTFTDIVGANGLTYTITNLQSTKSYRVVATSGACSSITSAAVTVTRTALAVGGTITSNKGASVCPGTSTTFTLAGSTGTRQWQSSTNGVDFTDIAASTGATKVIVISSPIWVRVRLTSGTCGFTYSNVLYTDVLPAANGGVISGQSSIMVNTGTSLTVTGSLGTRQWQRSTDGVTFTAIAASNVTTLATGNLAVSTSYRVKSTVGTCFVYSPVFTVTVNSPRSSEIASTSFGAVAYPNPFADNFMLEVSASTNETIQVNVYDMLGKLVENHNVNVSDLSTFVIGNKFVSGVYNIEVIQGTQIERLRVVKN
jgi:hypothetical protein